MTFQNRGKSKKIPIGIRLALNIGRIMIFRQTVVPRLFRTSHIADTLLSAVFAGTVTVRALPAQALPPDTQAGPEFLF